MLRFAPSPTGDMHIGNLRVALMNYIVARQRGEGFILRIEDTDKARNIEGKDEEIRQILEKFSIRPEQVIYQSHHEGRHQHLAVKLVEEGKAFLCICSEEDLQKERERAGIEKRPYRYSGHCAVLGPDDIQRIRDEKIPFTIRIRKPEGPILFKDMIKGEIITQPHEVDHFVILRADGSPTYNFACACDDMTGGISLIIRGEDHVSNTPKQIHVQHSLGYESGTEYAHLPIILNAEGRKMSKRDDASSVRWLLEEGFLPDAIINYLLLLGNNTPVEIFTLPDAVEWFDLKKLSRSPARFDLDRLRHLNREHLRRMDDVALSRIFGFADADIGRLAKLYLEEASTVNELDTKIKAVFSPKKCPQEWSEEMKLLSSLIMQAPMFDTFDTFKTHLSESTGLRGKRLFKPLRILMTGAEHGPELGDIYSFIKPYITEVVRCQP